jgi:hypothetical protein
MRSFVERANVGTHRRFPITEETMTTGIGQPYTGSLSFDLNPVASILIDLPPGGMRGMRRQQPGMTDVITELATAVPNEGAAAGVPMDAYQRFVDSTDKVDRVRKHRLALLKAAEVLAESEAVYEDQREQALSQMVDAVRSTAKRNKNKAIVAPFERSIRYTSQAADKAVKTRNKKAAAKAKAGSEPVA